MFFMSLGRLRPRQRQESMWIDEAATLVTRAGRPLYQRLDRAQPAPSACNCWLWNEHPADFL